MRYDIYLHPADISMAAPLEPRLQLPALCPVPPSLPGAADAAPVLSAAAKSSSSTAISAAGFVHPTPWMDQYSLGGVLRCIQGTVVPSVGRGPQEKALVVSPSPCCLIVGSAMVQRVDSPNRETFWFFIPGLRFATLIQCSVNCCGIILLRPQWSHMLEPRY